MDGQPGGRGAGVAVGDHLHVLGIVEQPERLAPVGGDGARQQAGGTGVGRGHDCRTLARSTCQQGRHDTLGDDRAQRRVGVWLE